ncbi:hypothetical protein [Streptomyces sp. NBC_00370]|uniref:hypothetical protein n=1 Tax=Streptomyces sp. NBC_00370 TaxID=2975728 RepID=UPI002E252BA7
MPLFGRRKQQSAGPVVRIGRKFHSDAGIEASVANFHAAATQQFGQEPVLTAARWTGPHPAPERLIAARTPSGTSYLALWSDGSMYFVAPDYQQLPTPPLVGMWKMRDNSLSSTGSVEASEFGADRVG